VSENHYPLTRAENSPLFQTKLRPMSGKNHPGLGFLWVGLERLVALSRLESWM